MAEMDPDDVAGDFEVDWIVDEVPQGRSSMYLVKWKGFELNIGDGREEKVRAVSRPNAGQDAPKPVDIGLIHPSTHLHHETPNPCCAMCLLSVFIVPHRVTGSPSATCRAPMRLTRGSRRSRTTTWPTWQLVRICLMKH